jgi:bidirectional [NiFe] hydrogenase diaphorase subunit
VINMTIDGQAFQAEDGQTVLEVARANGIRLPALCYHPALKPSGACRLCAVEVTGKSGRLTTMLSCVLRVKEGLAVRTTGELVKRARQQAFERLLTLAPQSESVRELAATWNVDLGPRPDGCIRCRLCIRVCSEIVGPGALVMHKRGGQSIMWNRSKAAASVAAPVSISAPPTPSGWKIKTMCAPFSSGMT